MKHLKLVLMATVIASFITCCEDEDKPAPDPGYSDGIYIVNEGSYGNSNGSISFYNPENDELINGLYEAMNGRSLGDVVQSMAVVSDTIGYIVVNNSSKVEIVSLRIFKSKVRPLSVYYPRYFKQVKAEKGYLTAGNYQGYVYTVDLNDNIIYDSIKVGFGPETMVILNNKVYVANSGGWSNDSTISVINATDDEVIDTITVGDVPMDMTLDQDDNLWVYSKGYTNYTDIETDAMLQKVNTTTGEVVWKVKVGTALDYSSVPPKCASSKDGSKIFYLRPDGVYQINIANPQLEEDAFIPGNFYGLDVNPFDGSIFVFETGGFSGNGTMKIYTETGQLFKSAQVGIGPNGAVFNQ